MIYPLTKFIQKDGWHLLKFVKLKIFKNAKMLILLKNILKYYSPIRPIKIEININNKLWQK